MGDGGKVSPHPSGGWERGGKGVCVQKHGKELIPHKPPLANLKPGSFRAKREAFPVRSRVTSITVAFGEKGKAEVEAGRMNSRLWAERY